MLSTTQKKIPRPMKPNFFSHNFSSTSSFSVELRKKHRQKNIEKKRVYLGSNSFLFTQITEILAELSLDSPSASLSASLLRLTDSKLLLSRSQSEEIFTRLIPMINEISQEISSNLILCLNNLSHLLTPSLYLPLFLELQTLVNSVKPSSPVLQNTCTLLSSLSSFPEFQITKELINLADILSTIVTDSLDLLTVFLNILPSCLIKEVPVSILKFVFSSLTPRCKNQVLALNVVESLINASNDWMKMMIEAGTMQIYSGILKVGTEESAEIVINSVFAVLRSPISGYDAVCEIIPGILELLPGKYLRFNKEIIKLLLIISQKDEGNYMEVLFSSRLLEKLQEILVEYAEVLNEELVEFLLVLLEFVWEKGLVEEFIEKGCYNALEYCLIKCKEPIKGKLYEIIDSYF